MWLGLLLILVGVFALIALVFAGGIFTIILVPVAVVAVIAAVFSLASARVAGAEGARRPGPGRPERGSHARPAPPDREQQATAEDLLKARQRS